MEQETGLTLQMTGTRPTLTFKLLYHAPRPGVRSIWLLVQVHATFFAIACLRCSTYLQVK
jgi:hypothetical protein